jgi:ribosomal-protein-serine acetyltransferase
MELVVDDQLKLQLLTEEHASSLFQLASADRERLGEWLPWLSQMKDVSFIVNYIKGTQLKNKAGLEYAFAILRNQEVIGRIGVYKIDSQNKIAEIGYWIGRKDEGKGIVTKCCKALLSFCFDNLKLNRLEIRCATANLRSQIIPEKLQFLKEGTLRQAEFINGKFVDLNLYALLKS